jgi:DNA-binding NtrC family response regulator
MRKAPFQVAGIPLLAQHFVGRWANELRCPKPQLTRAGIIQLQGYDWPGNVRELQNVIERDRKGGQARFRGQKGGQ